jgi:hypothetical protein
MGARRSPGYMVKYDDASWHYGGDFPTNSPIEFGGTHIGLFIKWCFLKGWAGELHIEEFSEDVEKVVVGKMSGTEYLFKNCDGKFTDKDLNAQGNQFAQSYYGEDGLYLQDYADHFGDLMYEAPDDAHDFNLFSSILNGRLKSGVLTISQADSAKPWWKIW